jgi:fumarylacetoacetate (FAA) hydrolase
MRLATFCDGSRDGRLSLVRSDGTRLADASHIARNLQAALDDWDSIEPRLREMDAELENGRIVTGPLLLHQLASFETDPLVYQGGSSVLLGPADDILLPDPLMGLDFEGEIAVILGDVPMGTRADDALSHVRLVTLLNDVTLRNLVGPELAKGFGFFQSKPATAFAPFVATPDELGAAWHDGRAWLQMKVWMNGRLVGDLETGPEMHFSFGQLIAHVAHTRAFTAGTILGSGTVSNADTKRGVSCLAERRTLEIIASPDRQPKTPYLKAGDRVAMEAFDAQGRSVFGRIEQKVIPAG